MISEIGGHLWHQFLQTKWDQSIKVEEAGKILLLTILTTDFALFF